MTEQKTILIEESELMTPTEIIEAFPDANLRKQDVGSLVRLGVVSGKKIKPRGTFVDKESFERYLKYRKTVPKMVFCKVVYRV